MARVCFCGGEEEAAQGAVPVPEILAHLDRLLGRDDLSGARELLIGWEAEAVRRHDLSGQLTVVNELIGLYRKTGAEADALAAVARADDLIGRLGISRERSAATVLLNQGTALCAFGRYEEAVERYGRAEQIYRESGLAAGDALWGGLYNNRATAWQELGRSAEAEEDFEKALRIAEGRADGWLDVAVTCINLAHLRRETGAPDSDIDELLERARACLDEPEAMQRPDYAFVCSKCAPSFGYFGYFLDRKEYEERARRGYERARSM